MAQWTTACPEWESLLVAKQSIIPPPIFPDQAEQALGIFKELRVSDLPGKPTFGECSEEWVFDFVNAIFGGYEAETGKQLIREYGLLISKKNTKSTIAAGIMLTALILCWREDEEHLILAPTKEVADNSFKPAAGMIRADEELSDMFQIQDHIRTITHRVTRNTLKVVAADTDTVSGKKSGRILVDELWLFGKRANAEAMFMEALGGQVSRNEGWVIFLTTQSDEPPAGVFKERLDYWRAVRDGKINDLKTLGVLYEFPDSMVERKAYLEPKNFYITNPNIGRSVSEEWIADQLLKNQNKTDGTLQQFLAKHLNIEIGLNLRSDRWAGVDFWEPQIRQVTFSDILQRAEVATVGIDGGGLDDLLGLYIIGRDKETREWIGWGHAWAHEIAVRRRKSEESRFNDFVKAGDLTVVKRVGQDTEEVAEYVSRINDAELLDKIGIDPSGVGQILDALVEAEIPEDSVVGVSQGWRLGGAIKTTERKLAEGVLIHGGQPLMAWCVGNARVEPKGNAILITKQASGKGKIDPLMALFNAVSLMALNPEAKKKDYQVFFI
ncbi:terminase large subunit [Salmonella enterica subsp. enterica serovar Javiana]|uniref:terminase large subunit n=1 Tax=unclassified Citrobacter freundii complex TaxID=2816438 RepID=UPI0009B05BA9|nr:MULTISPECIES: terminase large subunit [unclassified Citrobacter freundii complex]EAA6335192.1 terminase large subunit [Salmonella enterica subsp. enterica serovar Coeln]EAB3858251.1 terminase large subunit [Salmonella enterica]EAP2053570.1 terminase large subunit [Salmonella enterica subsp. enterica serovar 4,[5],12:i:-]EDK0699921.1 terminase large subunit [Salmonella bongori]EDQ0288890.1 terminase large subunit [Salmonella enterica subsp. enterica serovar Javiana]EJP2780085.1 terminase la